LSDNFSFLLGPEDGVEVDQRPIFAVS